MLLEGINQDRRILLDVEGWGTTSRVPLGAATSAAAATASGAAPSTANSIAVIPAAASASLLFSLLGFLL
eukprot:1216724-Alexandrium_andersonii.AAC.1